MIDLTKKPSRTNIPLTVALLTVKKEPVFHVSKSSGKSSLLFTFEVTTPATVVDREGNEQTIGGLEITQYLSIEEKSQGRLIEFHGALSANGNQIPDQLSLNEETGLPEGITYTGMSFYANVKTSTDMLKNGDEALVNPITGKAQTTSRLELTRFLSAD